MNLNLLPLTVWALLYCITAAGQDAPSPPVPDRSAADSGAQLIEASATELGDKEAAVTKSVGQDKTGDRTEPTSAEIARWIEQLNSDEYWTREDATRRLFQAGEAAVGAVGEAARSHKLETSTRAVGVLTRLLELDNPQIEEAAETVLEEIAHSRVTSAASRAEAALLGYRERRQDRVLARLRQLGATIAAASFGEGEYTSTDITIGEAWQGSTEDLAALKRVPSLRRLSVYQSTVDDKALAHLLPLKQLRSLQLYGAGISTEGEKRLKAELVSTQVDCRKGGLLGVHGDLYSRVNGCLVTYVQPGSAADKAGLQPGDVVTKFQGKAVADFDSLTALIATKRGGETVELELERQTQVGDKIEKQTLTKSATLDRWKEQITASPGSFESQFEGRIIIGR